MGRTNTRVLRARDRGLDIFTNGLSFPPGSLVCKVNVSNLHVRAWYALTAYNLDSLRSCRSPFNVLDDHIADLNFRRNLKPKKKMIFI